MEVKRYKIKGDMSRYSKDDRIVYDTGETVVETHDREIIQKSNNDTFYEVTAADANRIDIISYNYYGTSKLYWAILCINDIIDPFNIPVGTKLRMPPLHKVIGGL